MTFIKEIGGVALVLVVVRKEETVVTMEMEVPSM